jgi:hypothetical protein
MSAKTGDMVVIYGRTKNDRDVIKYTSAKDLVAYIRERDYPDGEINSNEEYMRTVVDRIGEVQKHFVLPHHNEEAFVAALFRIGMFGKTTLN